MNTGINELLSHCVEFMCPKDIIIPFLREHGIQASTNCTYKELGESMMSVEQTGILSELTQYFRRNWIPADTERHIAHLTSGMLQGHDWHRAAPSMLHRSLQNYVRKCCEGSISLEKYLGIGTDIVRHEYFMVATHDICETAIIRSNETAIPSIRKGSITDFVFNGIPYDLKVTRHPEEWLSCAGSMDIGQKMEVAFRLYSRADSARIRKEAESCRNNWGLNRMYFLVSEQDRWLSEPERIISYLLEELRNPDNFFQLEIYGYPVRICLIEQ